MRRALLTSVVSLSLLGCQQETKLPQNPQLLVDRLALDFGAQVGEATYVGQEVNETLQIKNGGLDPLTINSVTMEAAAAFTRQGPSQTELQSEETAFITITFKPTAAGHYSGQLSVATNAEATQEHPSSVTVQLSADAVPAP